MTRLKDIAEHAGVSVMTVSKALRDAPDVSAATKGKIKALAQELGYVPDSSAQGLRTRTTKLFGLAVSSCADPFVSRIVLAIEEATYQMGYDLLLAHTANSAEREEACIQRFLARRVDGVFIAPVYRNAPETRAYKELLARHIPTVILGPSAPFCDPFVCIETDDQAASAAATSHLIKLGHKRIAFLTGTPGAPWAQQRFDGYRAALREVGFDTDDKLVFPAGRSLEDGARAAAQMITEAPAITAVLAVNDLVALGFARTCLERGLRIPTDLSLVGFGNIPLCEHFQVPLTTLRQPKHRLGTAAVAAMQQLLHHARPEVRPLGAELIVRASTAPPPPAFPFHKPKAS